MSNRPRHRGRVTDPAVRDVTLTVFGDRDRPYVVLNDVTGEAWSWCSRCRVLMDLDLSLPVRSQLCSSCSLVKKVGV